MEMRRPGAPHTMSVDTALATVDTRPYFERVLRHALQAGIVDDTRLAALKREGAKGIVQLAGYFGTASLRRQRAQYRKK